MTQRSDKSPARRARVDRRLLAVVGVLVAVGGVYLFQVWQRASARAEARALLLRETRDVLAEPEPDRDQLSRSMAGLLALPDAGENPTVLSLRAEIELVRGDPAAAHRIFAAVAQAPGAPPTYKRLGARVLLAYHEGFAGSATEAETLLAEAARLASDAFEAGGDAADLLRVWQAHKRLFDDAAAAAAADRLRDSCDGSPQARLVALSQKFEPSTHQTAVADLCIDLVPPPRELCAMQVLVELFAGNLPYALELLEPQLAQAPNVWVIRFAAAMVFEAHRRSAAAGSPQRERFLRRRNEMYDWLLQRAPADYPLQAQWRLLRDDG